MIRATFSLWYWPVKDKQAEYELVTRFVAPSVTHGLSADGERASPRY